MTLEELKDEINAAIARAGFITNGDTWKKDGVAYLAVEIRAEGVAVSGRIFTADGLSYTFISALQTYRLARKTFTPDLGDNFVEMLLSEATSLAEAGELPLFERSGAL